MHQRNYQVVVLRPTAAFLSLLAIQLSESELPSLELLQTDNTSYLIPKAASDDELLELLQQFSPTIFHHEIYRWLGDKVFTGMEFSFFDFLRCFKFEIHSHILLMEPNIQQGHQALIIKPRSLLFQGIQASSTEQGAGLKQQDRVALTNMADCATVMIKNFSKLSEIKPFIERNYGSLFDLIKCRMSKNATEWPRVNSFHAFKQYFTIHIHTQLISLESLAMAA